MRKKSIRVYNVLALTKFKHICRIMRIMFLLGFLCISSTFAININSQTSRINIDVKHVYVKEVIKQIEEQTDYLFVYNNKKVNLNKTISMQVENGTVADVLDQMFLGTNISYVVEGRNILLINTEKSQQRNSNVVTGTIIDASGTPIIGANVMVKGTTIGTITDMNGKFSIEASIGDNLEISYIGYITQSIRVGDQKELSVTLKEDSKALEEVVVVGYGTQKKGNLTGSIASVKTEELTVAPVASSINSLGGKLPGLVSQQTSGQPGSDQATIKVRGFADNAIWIVDGIEADFNYIDPNQIESISILKDGSASIYGARAGNGVILVTTKRGIAQKPTVTINSSVTFQGITTMPKPVSSGDYATLKREEWLQAGNPESTAPFTEEQIQKYYAGNDPQYPNTDWYSELIRNWAPQNQHNISVRGGSDKIKYYGFLGYMNQESMWKNNGGNYRRYNLQSNIDANITDNLSIQFDIAVMKSDNMTTTRGQGAGENTVWQDFWKNLYKE